MTVFKTVMALRQCKVPTQYQHNQPLPFFSWRGLKHYLFLYFRQPVCTDGIQAGAGTPVVPVQHQSNCQDTTAYENNTDGIQLVGGRWFLVWAGAQKVLKCSVKNRSYLPKKVKAFMFYIFNFLQM